MQNIKDYMTKEFNNIFRENKENYSLFFAPGRINLIGEHTDYTGGLVFPAGIDCGTYIVAAKNNSGMINVISLNFDKNIQKINPKEEQKKVNLWVDYFKGTLNELKNEYNDINQGFDAVIYGNIPNGAGLSSSASLEMVSFITILDLNNKNKPEIGSKEMTKYALLGQKVENNFIGSNTGIMDQFAIGNAKENCAIKLDCYDMSFEYCPLNLGNYSILVSNTNKLRKLEESQYNQRRSECETGFEMLKKYGLKKEALGRISIEEWKSLINNFDNHEIIKKRLNHVITENYRVKDAVSYLKQNDIKNFAKLINASGVSLKNDFEVTGLHLDSLVDAAITTNGVLASRMMGGGFGGCTLSIVETKKIESVKIDIEKKYFDKTNLKPSFYIFKISSGTRKID
jgi:galactokinase